MLKNVCACVSVCVKAESTVFRWRNRDFSIPHNIDELDGGILLDDPTL